LIPHEPLAPVPVGLGTSVPIANPRLVRAAEAVVAPVPPLATATVPLTFVAVVAVEALPLIAMFHVPLAPVPVGLGTSVPIARPKLVRAPAAVVPPVPPLATANVPARVIVPLLVIGPPEVVRPVVPPETPTEVTEPLLASSPRK